MSWYRLSEREPPHDAYALIVWCRCSTSTETRLRGVDFSPFRRVAFVADDGEVRRADIIAWCQVNDPEAGL